MNHSDPTTHNASANPNTPSFEYKRPGRATTTYENTPPEPNPKSAIEIARNAKW